MDRHRLMTTPFIAVLAMFGLLALPALAAPITIEKYCINCSLSAWIDGFGTNTIRAGAEAFGFYGYGRVSMDLLGYTRGPVRDGVIQIRGQLVPSWSPEGWGSAAFSVDRNGCDWGGATCIVWYEPDLIPGVPSYRGEMRLDAELPFTLGVPFQISIYASFEAYQELGPETGASGRAWVDFSLFEREEMFPGGPTSDRAGEEVMVFDEDVPEPNSNTLVALGFGVLMLLANRGRRKIRRETAVSPSQIP